MLDRTLLDTAKPLLQYVAETLARRKISADAVTWTGFGLGIAAAVAILAGWFVWAIIAILLNRLADGVDGSLARMGEPTDRGGFLDIVLDFIFYALVPLAFAFHDPSNNALYAALLIFSFVGTGSSFLAFAIIAAKRGISNPRLPKKGFYYIGGLTEASETIIVFILMCLWPQYFAVFAGLFAVLCLLTTAMRIREAMRILAAKPPQRT